MTAHTMTDTVTAHTMTNIVTDIVTDTVILLSAFFHLSDVEVILQAEHFLLLQDYLNWFFSACDELGTDQLIISWVGAELRQVGMGGEYEGNKVELERLFKALTHVAISSEQLFVVFSENHMLALGVTFMCLTLILASSGVVPGSEDGFHHGSEEREEQESRRWKGHGL